MTHSLTAATAATKKPLRAFDGELTDGQRAVLRAFHEFGKPMDDLALAVYVHHIEDDPMSSSSVRSRRAELSRGPSPLLQVVDTKRLRSGRQAAVHGLTTEGKLVANASF